ncbi:hypothetical protein GobsT_63120 [Gemmata obscuriglobus]|nr:hypothetical protein [Gemmata obscuriglobus]QEG31490.1 hypothetical protein GobsT_63120 [Gemmata obscuriglobus]VTS10832.1 unnamed protein product [Gemmata obscuriglobus UQM 2246]
MSGRRMLIAVALACGLCVWGYARSGDQPVTAHGFEPISSEEAEYDEETRDDAANRYRTNQPRHWRYMAVGNSYSH